jgi:uncharacterized protein YcfJ
MANKTKVAFAAITLALATQAMASITLYEGENFRGRAVTIDRPVRDLDRMRFDDRAGSIIVDRGRWEVCERERFEGRCALLRRGHYESLRSAGLDWNISSIRPAESRRERRYDVEPQTSSAPLYEYRRRPNEVTHEVPVNWSRAVMGPPNQRCWVERQAVPTSNANVGGAVAGAVIGGILGHQVGKGSGRDAATAAGVVGGAVVGANVGGGNAQATQDVQRCRTEASGPPAYYEVSYNFRGTEHRVQMGSAPGRTVLVNDRGEPRM